MQGETYEVQQWTCDACGKAASVTVHAYAGRSPGDTLGMPVGWAAMRLSYAEYRGGRYDLCPDCLPDAERRAEQLAAFLGAAIVYPPELQRFKPKEATDAGA